jgi:hypothetical protein
LFVRGLRVSVVRRRAAGDARRREEDAADRGRLGQPDARAHEPRREGRPALVVNAYGQSVSDPDPQMVTLNRQYYGVDTIAQLIAKYHPGGIIYFNCGLP